MTNGPIKDGKVVDFYEHREPHSSVKGAFSAPAQRVAGQAAKFNEQILGMLSNILVDETLPFYVASLDGTVIHTNDHYLAISRSLGNIALAPGNVMNVPIEAASEGFNSAGQYHMSSLNPIIDDVLASDTTVRTEEVVTIKDRERVFLGRHIPVRNKQREIIAVAGTYEDVTMQVRGIEAANKTQAQFQDFARASSDWFFECDADLRVSSLSDRFTAIVGQPASLFVGSHFEQFGRFEKNLENRLDGPRAFSSRKPFREQLFIVTGPGGTDIKFHLSGVPVFNRVTGVFDGYRGVGMDVTSLYAQSDERQSAKDTLESLFAELTRNNIALDEATEQAKSALRAKNEFLAAMSHELRTPLNAIIGFAEAFQHETFGRLDDTYIEYSKDISTSGEHLLSLINDILDVAVIEGGGLSLQLDKVNVEQLITKAVHMNIEAARFKNIKTSALNISTNLNVLADERRAIQILVNLLSNAIKFTPEGGEIGLEIFKIGNKLSLTVWDTGVGISRDQQARIFEKFHQVTEHIYSRRQEGAGLGLHISRQLARKMNGELSVESVEGQGSRFTVTLPIATKANMNANFV